MHQYATLGSPVARAEGVCFYGTGGQRYLDFNSPPADQEGAGR